MNRLTQTLLVSLLLLLGFLPARADNEAKSDYYFMEAMRMRALGNDADADVLLNRAYELNPDPASEITKSVAFAQVTRSGNDSIAFADALAKIERYVSLKPDDFYAAVSLAGYYANIGDLNKALPLIARADSLNPSQPTLALRHASLLERLGRTQDAIDVYKRVEVREGKRTQLTYAITRLMFNVLQDTVGALAEVDALTAALPGDVEALTLAISLNEVAGHTDEVRRLGDRAISMEPDNLPLREFYIQSIYDIYGMDGALEVFGDAIKADDLSTDDKAMLLTFFIGEMNVKPEDSSKPFNGYLKALEIYDNEYPDDVALPLLRSGIAIESDDLELAIKQIERAIELSPTSPEIRAQWIKLLVRADRIDEAIAAGRDALLLEEFENNLELRLMLTGAYAIAKKYQEIPPVLTPLLDAADLDDSARSEILATIADAEQNYRPAEEVAKTYDEAIALDPENYMAQNNYAYMISEKGGDLELAKKLIGQVLKNAPNLPTYLDTAAWVYYKLGQYLLAKDYIDKAIAAVRGDILDAELMLHAGDIYYRCGNAEKALDYWQRALEMTPDSQDLMRRVELKRIPE